MTTEYTEVKLKIFDNDFKIRCAKEEADDLIASAKYVEDKMHDIRGEDKKFSYERVAVITALNTAHELLTQGKNSEKLVKAQDQIKALTGKIDLALSKRNRQCEDEIYR
jgi:cell division protein ZapA